MKPNLTTGRWTIQDVITSCYFVTVGRRTEQHDTNSPVWRGFLYCTPWSEAYFMLDSQRCFHSNACAEVRNVILFLHMATSLYAHSTGHTCPLCLPAIVRWIYVNSNYWSTFRVVLLILIWQLLSFFTLLKNNLKYIAHGCGWDINLLLRGERVIYAMVLIATSYTIIIYFLR